MGRKNFILMPLFLFLLSCSVQKRHYQKGFYIASNSHSSKTTLTNNPSFSEKMNAHGPIASNDLVQDQKEQVLSTRTIPQPPDRHTLHSKKGSHAILKESKKQVPGQEDKDPKINHVAKAGLRLAIYSLLFLGAAMYLFFELAGSFYIVLALLIITFIFALVSLLTSIQAKKDTIATNRTGRRMARIAIFITLLILCGIGLFFVYTPIEI